jgi:hypothetical protein
MRQRFAINKTLNFKKSGFGVFASGKTARKHPKIIFLSAMR